LYEDRGVGDEVDEGKILGDSHGFAWLVDFDQLYA
jgi:hypothetical protein